MDAKHKAALGIVVAIVVIAIVVLINPFRERVVEEGPNTGLSVGQFAPNFRLQNLNGDEVALSDFKGDKAVVLNFWATWCPFCVDEMPYFQRGLEGIEDDVVVLGVNLQEDLETAKEFVERIEVTFPILMDPNSDVTNAYNVRAQPTTYFIDKSGKIVDKRAGPLSEEEVPVKMRELVEASARLPAEASFSNQEIQTLPDGTKYIIHPSKIRSGGPPKDGIPSIDNPKFISAEEASFLTDDELVLGIEIDGDARAYPFQVLVWHEIVNDFFGELPVLVTYCPLCGTAIAFDRTIEGEAVEFGTSGKLFNSNLVMYDRKTDTYWNQVGARGIIGELTGHRLKLLPSNTVTWGEWLAEHPETKVLSQDTGFSRSYGRDPYDGYYTSRGLFFPVEEEDDRLHQKAVIYGIEINDKFKAYPDEKLNKGAVVQDTFEGVNLEVQKDESSIITVRNKDTGEDIPFERHFWFSWFAFHPDTELF